jgi:hypothetical protein
MIDLMDLSGCTVRLSQDKYDAYSVQVASRENKYQVFFATADTEYEAIRRAFNVWNKNNA